MDHIKIYVGYDLEDWAFPLGCGIFNNLLKINILCFYILIERCENG